MVVAFHALLPCSRAEKTLREATSICVLRHFSISTFLTEQRKRRQKHSYKLFDALWVLLFNANKKSAMTSRTDNFNFVGVHLQTDSTWLLLQIHYHFAKIRDSVREQADVVREFEMFEEK